MFTFVLAGDRDNDASARPTVNGSTAIAIIVMCAIELALGLNTCEPINLPMLRLFSACAASLQAIAVCETDARKPKMMIPSLVWEMLCHYAITTTLSIANIRNNMARYSML